MKKKARAAPEAPLESFGARLARLRKAAGMSQPELAAAANVSQSTVAHMETGRRGTRASYEILLRLAKALSVSVEYLSGGEP